jgi:hypothetical protein
MARVALSRAIQVRTHPGDVSQENVRDFKGEYLRESKAPLSTGVRISATDFPRRTHYNPIVSSLP